MHNWYEQLLVGVPHSGAFQIPVDVCRGTQLRIRVFRAASATNFRGVTNSSLQSDIAHRSLHARRVAAKSGQHHICASSTCGLDALNRAYSRVSLWIHLTRLLYPKFDFELPYETSTPETAFRAVHGHRLSLDYSTPSLSRAAVQHPRPRVYFELYVGSK